MKILANQYLKPIIALIQSHETVKNESKINREKQLRNDINQKEQN